MSKRLWYLSGGMQKFGKENFNESNDWRIRVGDKIRQETYGNITVFNPNNHYSFCSDPESYTEREVMNLDIFKLRNSELIIFNDNDPYSRGSMIELGIGYERRIPIFVLHISTEPIHCWVRNMAEKVFISEEELIEYLIFHYYNID